MESERKGRIEGCLERKWGIEARKKGKKTQERRGNKMRQSGDGGHIPQTFDKGVVHCFK